MNGDTNRAFVVVCEVCRSDISLPPPHPAFPRDPSATLQAYKVAVDHGLGGLFYRKLSELGETSSAERDVIRASALTGAARCYQMLDEFLQVCRSFGENGIEWIAFKGPMLAHAYPKISDRSFTDLDILIRPVNLLRASNLLEERGYSIDPNYAPVDKLLDREADYHARFQDANGFVIELHWAFNSSWNRLPLDTEGMWQRAECVSRNGIALSVLTTEDTLLLLCVHGFKHEWSRLKWVMDIAYLVRDSDPIDWDTLEHEASVIGCHRILLLGLGLASDLLGAPIPQRFQDERLNDRIARKLIRLYGSAITQDRPLTRLETMLCELQAREGFRAHLKSSWLVLSRIFRLTSEDLPTDASIFLKVKAIFLRPARLYRTFGWTWIRAVLEFR